MEKIVILGSGLGGMITALSLAAKGHKTLLLEKTDLNFPKDNRNIAITNFSKMFFEEIGLWKELEPYMAPIKDVYVVDNFAPTMLHFDKASENYDALGYMVEAKNLREIVSKNVHSNPLIDLRLSANYKVEDGIFYLEEKEEKADLIIICDGKNSKVRKDHFKDQIEKSYNQSAIILNVSHAKRHENTAVEHFMPRGVFAILPLCKQNESSIVWVEKPEIAELYSRMDQNELVVYLKERFGDFLGDIEIISDVQAYPLSARLTEKYYNNNLVLIADSAHNIHPLAGQGLNQGIKDIKSLTYIISRNVDLGLKINNIALQEYENSRKTDNYFMYLITDNLNRFFCNNIPVLRFVRKIGIALIDKMPKLKAKFVL